MSSMQYRKDQTVGMPETLLKHRDLTLQLARREVADRYVGQFLGSFWAIAHPMLVMAVYLFMFAYVFKVRIGGTLEMPLDYPVYLLSGLVPWLALSEVLNKGPITVTSNASLVKQVVFPIEVLPTKTVLAATVAQATGLLVLTGYVLFTYHYLPWTFVLLPIVVAMHLTFMIGLSFFLGALGVFVRDLKDIIQVLTLIGIYLMPVLYLPTMVPSMVRPLLYLNPFSYLIWCYQDVCYFGRLEHPIAWVVTPVMAIGAFLAGSSLFRRLKPMFGNAL